MGFAQNGNLKLMGESVQKAADMRVAFKQRRRFAFSERRGGVRGVGEEALRFNVVGRPCTHYQREDVVL